MAKLNWKNILEDPKTTTGGGLIAGLMLGGMFGIIVAGNIGLVIGMIAGSIFFDWLERKGIFGYAR